MLLPLPAVAVWLVYPQAGRSVRQTASVREADPELRTGDHASRQDSAERMKAMTKLGVNNRAKGLMIGDILTDKEENEWWRKEK